MKGNNKTNWSWGYRGITKVAKEFKSGVRWRLGNGKRIHTIGDAWITGEKLEFKRNTPPEIQENLKKVETLIDINRKNWNQDLIWRHFSSNDAHRILKIHVPQSPMEDELIWNSRTTGTYSVKT